ncbi:bifunctional GlmU protein [Thraustotheca clavata]|uniref:Bifunctional GlmU protein n=1 Tax=Thraustotheca clavata TaxID=74557 RepID=A0A1V9ZDX3_9STRA|nr:bifunctional GlmU protein [Thraustotheca clavata]
MAKELMSSAAIAGAIVTIIGLHVAMNVWKRPASVEVVKRSKTTTRVVQLDTLEAKDIPLQLTPAFYFKNLDRFKHAELLEKAKHVFAALDSLHEYIATWLGNVQQDYNPIEVACNGKEGAIVQVNAPHDVLKYCSVFNYSGKTDRRIIVENGGRIMGGVLDVSEGSIYIGTGSIIEPNVFIKGPAIIGDNCVLRHGAYLRGDVVLGDSVVLRAEVKHALIMDNAELCHPGYCGDSLCGYKSHFANQVSTANLTLMSPSSSTGICIQVNGISYDTGRRKIGVVLGDYSQLGCNVATDPCTLFAIRTNVYALTRVNKGIYGPNEIIKNKPMEKGVIERARLHS